MQRTSDWLPGNGVSRGIITILGRTARAAVVATTFALPVAVQAAFILEIDTDGMDDGTITFNPGFSFGGDTTTASQSIASTAFGTTGGDSIFGGDGAFAPDTYVYTYTPTTEPDNLVITAGTDLGDGNLASGITGGGTGTYRVYATWPFTDNVSGGDTRYTISSVGFGPVIVDIDQNGGGAGAGNEWVLLGDIGYSNPLSSIQVTQEPTSGNTFASMRAHGLLFELITPPDSVPEPGTLALLAMPLFWLRTRRRRR